MSLIDFCFCSIPQMQIHDVAILAIQDQYLRRSGTAAAKRSTAVLTAGLKVCAMIQGMNHFTILTDNLDATRSFYCDILGLREGYRPSLGMPGLWLYASDQAILHVVKRS